MGQKPIITRVRVRGVYATALTKILLDEGFQIVQASNLIATRFNIPQLPLAADVTVKSIEDEPSRLLVIGFPEHTDNVLNALYKYISYSPRWCSRVGLYATVAAKLEGVREGKCIARIGDVELEVSNVEECKEGELLAGYIVKAPIFPGERGRMVPGIRVIGGYAMLYKAREPRVTFSEHISRAERRALLSGLALEYTSRGLGVHWRSSARDAEESELREELRRLEEELRRVEERVNEMIERGESGIVTPGEKLCIVELSAPDKQVLDDIRHQVIPTMPLHHSVKSVGQELEQIVDFGEKLLGILGSAARPALGKALLEYLAEKLQGRRVKIIHVKLDGRILELGSGYVREARVKDGRLLLTIERVIRSPGTYDGLGVEKEPGDQAVTSIDTGAWTITHKYYSRTGELKGIYVNINTPPEVSLDRVRYIDLSVDIVRTPDGDTRVIDVEEFKRYVEAGIVPEKLVEKVREIVRSEAGQELQI